jgi:hypothetical protein
VNVCVFRDYKVSVLCRECKFQYSYCLASDSLQKNVEGKNEDFSRYFRSSELNLVGEKMFGRLRSHDCFDSNSFTANRNVFHDAETVFPVFFISLETVFTLSLFKSLFFQSNIIEIIPRILE